MAFDPTQPYEFVNEKPKGFDPSQPFDIVPSDDIATVTVRPEGADDNYDRNMIPRGDAPRTEPSPRPGIMERVGKAVASAFKGPYGPSKETLGALTNGPNPYLNYFNTAVVDWPLTALDAVSRVPQAAVKGYAAGTGGAWEALGMDPSASERLERDMNVLGDVGLTLSTTLPSVPTLRTPVKPVSGGKYANKLQDAAAWLAEIEPDELDRVRKLVAEGYPISPAYAQGLPSLRRSVDMARALGYDPTGRSSIKLARDRVQQILEQTGKTPEEASELVGKLMGPYTPTLEDAAELIGNKASNIQSRVESENSILHGAENAARESEIANIQQNANIAANVKSNVNQSAIDRLAREKNLLVSRVDDQIKQGWSELENVRKNTSPTLGEDFPQRLADFRSQMSKAFSDAYDQVIGSSGDTKVDAATMRPAVKSFLENMPDDLKRNQPELIRAVTAIAENGTATLPELQYLRSALRNMADYDSLEPNFKKGPYKYFASAVNNLIHNENVPSQWRGAVRNLDRLDQLYGENMAIWRDKAAQSLVDQTRAGVAPDPAYVVNVLNNENQSARRKALLNIATPELRKQVWGATVDDLIQRSLATENYGTEATGPATVNPSTFLKNVVDLDRAGVLRDYAPDEAGRIVTLARRIAQKSGDIEIDPKSVTDNGFARTLQNIHDTDVKIAQRLKRDPATVLKEEMDAANAKIKEVQQRPSSVQDVQNPIGEFATPSSRNLINVTESLLEPENIDLLRRVVKTLGKTADGADSPELTLLRERATERILKPFLDVDPSSRRVNPEAALRNFKKLSRNTQDILFPGLSETAIPELAAEMRTIVGDAVKSMPGMAANAILSSDIRYKLPKIIWYRATAYMLTRPAFAKAFIGEALSGGNAVTGAKLAVRNYVNNLLEAELRAVAPVASGNMEKMPEPPLSRPKRKSWQERLMDGDEEQPAWMKGFARGGAVDTSSIPNLPYSDVNDTDTPSPYLMKIFEEASRSSGIPLNALLAIAKQESNFNPHARGSSGEVGLMQIMPSTARQPGYGMSPLADTDLADPHKNVMFGANYLAAVGKNAGVKDFNDPEQLAIALKRYNGGGDPNYVANVTRYIPKMPNVAGPDATDVSQVDTDLAPPTPTVADNAPQQPPQLDGMTPQQTMQVLSFVQKLLGNKQYFAEGGLVQSEVPTTPEPQRDIDAQTDTMADPQAGKDTVFIAAGSPLPGDIPDGAILVKRPEGFLLTMNPQKAAAYQEAPKLTDTFMADILGYSESKSETINPSVVQGVQPPDQVTSEQLASPGNEDAAVQAILAQDPTAALRIMTPDQAQQRRAAA